jgi:hypothetical protein
VPQCLRIDSANLIQAVTGQLSQHMILIGLMETMDKVSFASGVKLEERQSYVSVNNGEIVEERVEMLSKISKKHHYRQHPRL